MKTIAMILLLVVTAFAQTNLGTITFTNKSGAVVRDAVVVKVEPAWIIYKEADIVGGGRIRIADLPKEIQEQFHYDAPAALAAEMRERAKIKNQQEAAAEARQALLDKLETERIKNSLETNALVILGHVIAIRKEGLIVMVENFDTHSYKPTPEYTAFEKQWLSVKERRNKSIGTIVDHSGNALLTCLSGRYYVGDNIMAIAWLTGDFDDYGTRIRRYTCDFEVAQFMERTRDK